MKIKLLHFFALLLLVLKLQAQLAVGKPKFLGNVVAANIPSNFDTYWNQITPENSTKWGSVESTRNTMNWTQADLAYNHAQVKGYKFKFHTLVWGSQYPGWITTLSAADQKAEIEEWMQSAATRYPNIWAIDVVNEPVKTPCPFKAALGGDGATGWDWVIESFRLARLYFPNAKLLINEYGTENDATARNTYLTIINLLKARGYIDGIGVQAHYFNLDNMSAAQMTTCLNAYGTTGLDVYISELDITGGNNETGQKNKYQELFPIMWEHNSVKGITLWGYIEGQTWRSGTGIITSTGVEKQAMTWLKGYLSGTTASLTVSPASLSVASASNTNSITVTSNQTWTVTDDQTWLSTSVTGGTNNGSFLITCSANNNSTSRSGTVTVTGGNITRTVTVTQSGSGLASARNFTVRARGTSNGAKIQLRINNLVVNTWTLSTTMNTYSFTSSAAGTVRIQFTNDATNRDVQVDYLQVNSNLFQSENQSINTAYYANGRCGGGSNSEMMHCNGYIEYAGSNASLIAIRAPLMQSHDVSVYPNPSYDGSFIINSDKSPVTRIIIHDMAGRRVKTLIGNDLSNQFISSQMGKGIYTISIQQGEKYETKKWVIN